MKRLFLYTLVLLSFAGCKSASNEPTDSSEVQFSIIGLEVLQEGYAPLRKNTTPTDAKLTDIWVIEGKDTLAHQVSSSSDFGTLSIRLKYGQHTLTFIGSGKAGQTVTQGVWSADKISDTYGRVYPITVSSSMSAQSVVLERANYALRWQSTDVVPTNVKTIEVSINNHRSTLEAGLMGGTAKAYTFTLDVTSYQGQLLPEFFVSGFCGAYGVEESITTTFRAKDASSNVLYSHSKTVPVLTKRRTIIKGELFAVESPASVSVNKEWATDESIDL